MSTQPSVIVPHGAAPLSYRQSIAPTTEMPSVRGLKLKVSNAVSQVFQTHNYESIDLEALLFSVLKLLDTTIHNYEAMKRIAKDYILSNFNIRQGKHLRLQDISMRSVVVGYSRTT